jgi:hypothetical protein
MTLIEVVHTMVLVAGGLAATSLVLLALPKSKLSEFLMPIIGWCFALFCGAYILSPVDLVPELVTGPFGLIDDAGALVAGICAARAALTSQRKRS